MGQRTFNVSHDTYRGSCLHILDGAGFYLAIPITAEQAKRLIHDLSVVVPGVAVFEQPGAIAVEKASAGA